MAVAVRNHKVVTLWRRALTAPTATYGDRTPCSMECGHTRSGVPVDVPSTCRRVDNHGFSLHMHETKKKARVKIVSQHGVTSCTAKRLAVTR